jgi:hypothetical protein
MGAVCKQENCTVGETGTCLLNNDPKTCTNRTLDSLHLEEQLAPLSGPAAKPRFPLSLSLTPDQVRQLSSSRYCHLVGILGAPDAGKTAALVSLYLLLARNRLAPLHFADSKSLMAFDDISQGARRWNDGHLPEQLTTHTELVDDRSAGFLHLRLAHDGAEPVDLLLPDLPGEWTTQLIDNGRTDRFDFLKSADSIWLMVDGKQLSTPNTRQWAIHRTKLLMRRLSALLKPAPRVILVITRRDDGAVEQSIREEIEREAEANDLALQIVEIASFADAGAVAPGTGILELLLATIKSAPEPAEFWPQQSGDREQRAIMRFELEGGR